MDISAEIQKYRQEIKSERMDMSFGEIINMYRDKEIITLRYGLNNTKEYTQKEVAEILGISQSYISRIEKKVIRKLKQVMIR